MRPAEQPSQIIHADRAPVAAFSQFAAVQKQSKGIVGGEAKLGMMTRVPLGISNLFQKRHVCLSWVSLSHIHTPR